MKLFKKFFIFSSFFAVANFFTGCTNEEKILDQVFAIAEKSEDFSADDIKILETIAKKDCSLIGGPNQKRVLKIVSDIVMKYDEFNSKNLALMQMIDKKVYNYLVKRYYFLIAAGYSFFVLAAMFFSKIENESKSLLQKKALPPLK